MVPRFASWGWIGGAVLAVLGCDGPAEEQPATETAPASAAEIALILPATDSFASRVVERVVGTEAGRARTIFSAARPTPEDPPSRQAEMVSEAVRRHVTALIVMPGEAAALAPALAEARGQGIPVVVLGEEVPARDGPAYERVAFPPLEQPVAGLVTATLAAAAELELPAEGPALIVTPQNSDDSRLPGRAAALREELTKRGVTVLPDLRFTISSQGPQEAITQAMAATPRPVMVLGTETTGIAAAMSLRNTQLKEQAFVIAGYIDNPDLLTLLDSGFCAAAVDGNMGTAAAEATSRALALIAGSKGSEVVTIPTPVRLSRKAPRNIPFVIPRTMADLPEGISKGQP